MQVLPPHQYNQQYSSISKDQAARPHHPSNLGLVTNNRVKFTPTIMRLKFRIKHNKDIFTK